MEKEPDCQTNSNLRAATVPFEQIPDQSRIFLDFLRRAPDVAAFYPPIIKTHGELAWRAPAVLQNYTVDRNRLSDALRRLNTGWNASSAALANIEILRDTDAVAVVTGQQAGLFTGALYTIYKALSIIRVAKCLQARGVKAVPVFWIASEDHDFAEIAETFIADRDGSLRELKITTAEANENLPVGRINLDDSIEQTNARLFDELPRTELSAKLRDLILNAYQSPRKISDAFALLMAELFGKFGLILLDPLDGELKRLAAPIYVDAVRKSAEITAALLERGNALEAAGYHQQILIEKDYFSAFLVRRKRQTPNFAAHKRKHGSRQKWKNRIHACRIGKNGRRNARKIKSERDFARRGARLFTADNRLLRRRGRNRVLGANRQRLSSFAASRHHDFSARRRDDHRTERQPHFRALRLAIKRLFRQTRIAASPHRRTIFEQQNRRKIRRNDRDHQSNAR